MRTFEHIILGCIGGSARTGREIGRRYALLQGVDPPPRVRIYTALPAMERRGWLVGVGRSGRANCWALSAAGQLRLESWILGPGDRPPPGRAVDLLVTLACLARARDDGAFLLRREVSRLVTPVRVGPIATRDTGRAARSELGIDATSPAPVGAMLGRWPLYRRCQRRQGLACEVLGNWLRFVPE